MRLSIPFMFGHCANDWAPGAVWLIAPAAAAAMGLSPFELGLLFTIHSVGAALAYFPSGWLSDQVRRPGILLASTFWWVSAGYVLASFADGFWTLAILLAVAGMGDAAWHPIATGVLVKVSPGKRARELGLHAMGGTFSEVGAPLAVGFLLTLVDWRAALQFSVLPTVAMGIVFLFIANRIPHSEPSEDRKVDLAVMWRVWSKRRGLLIIAMISAYNMSLLAMLSMTPLFLQERFALSPDLIGLAFSVMVLLGALLQPATGHWADRHGGATLIRTCTAIGAVAAAVLWIDLPLFAVLALQVVVIGVMYAIRSAILAETVSHVGRSEGTTLGFAFAILDGVGAAGAFIAGAVADIDLAHAFLAAAVFAATSCGLSFFALERKNPQATQCEPAGD